MPTLDSHRWTADDVRGLPEQPGTRFECVDGALLVIPSPRLAHQSAVLRLSVRLDEYCRTNGFGALFTAPGELELDAHTLVQPDLFVLPLVNDKRPVHPTDIGHPLLFVEVLSPGTARFDRVVKRDRYQRHRVEYWIVDLDARLVERWMPDSDRPEIMTSSLQWQPKAAARALLIDLDTLFAEALGER